MVRLLRRDRVLPCLDASHYSSRHRESGCRVMHVMQDAGQEPISAWARYTAPASVHLMDAARHHAVQHRSGLIQPDRFRELNFSLACAQHITCSGPRVIAKVWRRQ